MEEKVLIVWSCTNGTRTHDQAVILMTIPKNDSDQTENSMSFNPRLEGLKKTASRYLTNELIDTIKWPEKPGLTYLNHNPFVCQADESYLKGIVILMEASSYGLFLLEFSPGSAELDCAQHTYFRYTRE